MPCPECGRYDETLYACPACDCEFCVDCRRPQDHDCEDHCPRCERTVDSLEPCTNCETEYCPDCLSPRVHDCEDFPELGARTDRAEQSTNGHDVDRLTADHPDPAEGGCPKCGHTEAEVDTFSIPQPSSTGLGLLSHGPGPGFRAVSCTNCGYTELYKSSISTRSLTEVFLDQ